MHVKPNFFEELKELHRHLGDRIDSAQAGMQPGQTSLSSAVQQAHRPADASVFSMMASDDDAGDSIISSQLIRVGLDKDVKEQYENFFFPRSPNQFLPIMTELAKLSARTNGFFSLLRFCLATSRRLANMDKQQRSEAVNREASRIIQNVDVDHTSNINDFLNGLSNGRNHVIVPSTRFRGGYDFQFIGMPAAPLNPTSALPTLNVPYAEHSVIEFIPSGKSVDETYKYEYIEAYASELSQGCVKTGKEVLSILTGEQSLDYKKAHTRVVKNIPLDFSFESINELFYNNTGILLTTDFFEDVSADVAKHFGEFMSVAAVRTPKSKLVRRVLEDIRAIEAVNRRNAGNENAAMRPPFNPSNIEDWVTEEGLALSQSITFSFIVSLPKEVANYVAQTEEGENTSLLSLHNWASIWARRYLRKKGARMEGGRIKRSEMPKFVLPLSKAQQATEIRAKNGFHIEKGKGDENNIFIAPNGALQYCAGSDARDEVSENLINYERDMEEYLTACFEKGMPVATTVSLPETVVAAEGSNDVTKEFTDKARKIRTYSGKLLSYDWDYNNTITANVSDPTSIVASDMVGAAKVNSLTLADYLGFNFANEGEEPIRKSFADSLVLLVGHSLGKKETAEDYVGNAASPIQFIQTGGLCPELLQFYAYCCIKGLVPDAQELVTEAAKELDLDSLDAINGRIHSGVISPELQVLGASTQTKYGVSRFLAEALRSVVTHCNAGSTLMGMVAEENEGASYSELREQVREHPHFFSPGSSPAVDFGRLYNYVGGMVFKIAMERLASLSQKDLFSIDGPVETGDHRVRILDKPSFSAVSKKILPLAVMFSKYIPNGEQIMRDAEEEIDANRRDDSLNEDDIQVAGCIEGAQMFPHQVKAHQSLRRRPAFSIMDIAPGGGKTSLGVTDIGAMVKELNDIGEGRIRPLILCPDGLIKNWVNDMQIFTGNKWNMIPVNSSIINRWGYEKLEELIRNAPVNSIVVAGFNFLGSRKETIVVGTHSTQVSNNLEFMKRFEFDYICIDESHKLKNKSTSRHKTVKQLTTGSHVRYLRLATGTLINDRVTDIVGQASLYNGHIFREGEVSNMSVEDSIERKVSLNGEDIPVWEVDTPQRARQKLSRYASVITMKKKEWAFMLPSPIETFIGVPMVPDSTSASEEDVQLGEMHKQLYDAVLQESVEELQDLIKKAKNRKASSEDGDDDAEEDEEETPDLEMKEGDELSMLSTAELTPYLARIERLVTNPMADPLAPDIFGAAGVQTYHSTKARYIAKRIDQHFNPPKWDKDTVFKEYTLVEYRGKLYLSRKLDKSSSRPTLLPESTRGVSPEDDIETWKEEPEGKIIVFCRYTNSVNGIYNALPEHYQRIAVKFTGEEDDKWANFDAFQNDPKVKILIANEMGIAEGHNMQMASRIIRVESPWAPGDLDQSSSRIFRPDPAAAKEMIKNGKPGELAREAIFLDWILCDGTMETAKQARLIAKIFNKARFDEAENETYDEVLHDYELEEIPMSLDTLRSRATLDDFSEYVGAYASLNGVQREEFHAMRATMDHTMKNLTPQEELPGFEKVQTPYVSNQKPDDSEGLNLVSLRNMLRNEAHSDLRADPTKLQGMPVVTDMGKGRIAKVRMRYLKHAVLDEEGKPVRTRGGTIKKEFMLDSRGKKIVDPDNPIVSVTVKQAGTNELLPTFKDTGILFMPTSLDPKTAKRDFHVNNLHTTRTEEKKAEKARQRSREAERKAIEAEEARRKREEDKELVREEKRRKKLKEAAKDRKAAASAGRKRRENIREGKPINKGVNRVKDVPPIKRGREDSGEGDMAITLHPAYYHGFLTLEVKGDDPDANKLKKLGFKETGPYAYVVADRYNRFDKVLDYIEDNFELSDASARRLEEIQDAFEEGPKGVYRMELAPQSTMPYFFATRKRPVKKRKEVRPYPIVMPDQLQIAVDMKTNPVIRGHVGKSVPGAATKWQKSDGHLLFFAASKAELRNKVRELKKAGFTIENMDELKAEVTNIRFRASKGKKK